MRNYFRGNTPARRKRIRNLQKKINAKRWKHGMRTFFRELKNRG